MKRSRALTHLADNVFPDDTNVVVAATPLQGSNAVCYMYRWAWSNNLVFGCPS